MTFNIKTTTNILLYMFFYYLFYFQTVLELIHNRNTNYSTNWFQIFL